MDRGHGGRFDSQRGGFPVHEQVGSRPSDATTPEVGMPMPADAGTVDREELETLKTGTTTVGLAVEDGVVLATDRRASLGRMVSSKSVQKIERVHPRGALTIAGSVSAAQSLVQSLRAEVSLYETRRGKDMSIHALASITGNFLRSGAFLIVVPVLGGVDEEGPQVYSLDALGGKTQEDYTVSGSGSQFALGVLEQNYSTDMSAEEGRQVAKDSVRAAAERDTASGNGMNLTVITEDGIDTTVYESFDEISD